MKEMCTIVTNSFSSLICLEHKPISSILLYTIVLIETNQMYILEEKEKESSKLSKINIFSWVQNFKSLHIFVGIQPTHYKCVNLSLVETSKSNRRSVHYIINFINITKSI